MREIAVETAPGITLACRTAGERGPRVLLLHGFPEAAFVWDGVIEALAGEAQCLAPNLRGFAGSSAPRETTAYKARVLIGDLVALIQGFGAPVDLLVAHDWGGALAWGLAAQRPELLRRLLIVNSPHPATFLRELRENPAQIAASAYMNWLCRPDAAARLAENGYAKLWPFFGGGAWLTEAVKARYRAVWDQGLDGALNYYRNSPLRPSTKPDDPINSLVLPDEAVTVKVPTRVLWAERDEALLPGLLDGLERWVPDLHVERVPEASHWIVHEQPTRVVAAIRAALAT